MLISTHAQINVMEDGKLSLDLLIGLSIFLFTFIFIANFLPGVFADVRNEINLAHQAYRIAALLVEDPGYPSDWETVELSNCNNDPFRPGLIVMHFNTSRKEYIKEYNHLDLNKTRAFARFLEDQSCREAIRKTLGLNLTDAGIPINYKFNVSLKNLGGMVITYHGGALLNHGDLGAGMQVLKFERIVYLSEFADNCDLIADRCIAKLEVRIWM